MTALFINLKINDQEKLDLFKITLSDIEHLFNECHIKIRGLLANECIIFARELFSDRAQFYQELQETDWVAASLSMIENVKSSQIFSYLEDHRLITSSNEFSLVLREFEKYQLDYLSYSFFRASRLDTNNLLPLNPKDGQKLSQFFLDKENIKLLSKISPLYFTFSLPSICSVDYFKKLLQNENKKFKINLRKLSSLLTIIFSYPKYKIVINFINFFLSFINSRLCLYPIDTPFNMEKLNIEMNSFEVNSFKKKLKFGILKNELFANFDDDNGAYGESLIKRGLYPFDTSKEVNQEIQNHIKYTVKFRAGDISDFTYYSQIHRINYLPRIFININYGKLIINYNNDDIVLEKGDYKGFYTNLAPRLSCIEDTEIVISVYDECFN